MKIRNFALFACTMAVSLSVCHAGLISDADTYTFSVTGGLLGNVPDPGIVYTPGPNPSPGFCVGTDANDCEMAVDVFFAFDEPGSTELYFSLGGSTDEDGSAGVSTMTFDFTDPVIAGVGLLGATPLNAGSLSLDSYTANQIVFTLAPSQGYFDASNGPGYSFEVDTESAAPEPASILTGGCGLAALLLLTRRRDTSPRSRLRVSVAGARETQIGGISIRPGQVLGLASPLSTRD